jgi:hypothetical protein
MLKYNVQGGQAGTPLLHTTATDYEVIGLVVNASVLRGMVVVPDGIQPRWA